MRVELKLTLEGSHVLSVNLIGDGPEDTFPDQTRLGVSYTQVVLIIHRLTRTTEVKIGGVEPVANDEESSDR